MRVLIATPDLYCEEWLEFRKNKTGFGLIVKDLIDELDELCELVVVTNKLTNGHCSILHHTLLDVLVHAKFRDCISGLRQAMRFSQPARERLKYFFYKLNKGYFRWVIQACVPDIVNVHSIAYSSLGFIEVCEELCVPYVVTLHGLNSIGENNIPTDQDKKLEQSFLRNAVRDNLPITVISNGVKERIETEIVNGHANNISVVLNGVRAEFYLQPGVRSEYSDLRKKLSLSHSTRFYTAIGSVCHRKNQMQILRALRYMPDDFLLRYHLVVCGAGDMLDEARAYVEQNNLGGHVSFLGFVGTEDVIAVLDQADFNVLASIDEGFGLSIIEAYARGVPSLTFDDIDALGDIYSPEGMVLCHEHSDKAFASALQTIAARSFDRETIKRFGRAHSSIQMAKDYLAHYEYVLAEYWGQQIDGNHI